MVHIGLGDKITKSLKNEHHIPAHSFSEWRTMSVQLENSHRIKLQFIVAQKMSFNIEPKDIAYSMTD